MCLFLPLKGKVEIRGFKAILNGIFIVRHVPDDSVSEYGGQRMVRTPERVVRITISASHISQQFKSIWKKLQNYGLQATFTEKHNPTARLPEACTLQHSLCLQMTTQNLIQHDVNCCCPGNLLSN